MNIHEYQAKEILKSYGVRIQEGIVADTPEAAVEAARQLQASTGTEGWVVKAQIHAGGRGKGKTIETQQEGVKFCTSLEKVETVARNLIGNTLVTVQTGEQGRKVNKVLVAQDVYYKGESQPKEYYLAILLDRSKACNVIMASTEGGVDIEEVAHHSPEKIIKVWINPLQGLQPEQAKEIADKLGLSGVAHEEMVEFITALYKAYDATDAVQFEINPCLKTSDNKIIAVDAKVNLDDNALFRHPELAAMRDLNEEDPLEVEASASGLNYVKLDGLSLIHI